MFWLQLMKSLNIALYFGNKKCHLAPLGPGYTSSSKGQNGLMQFLEEQGWCSLYVTGCGWALLRERDRRRRTHALQLRACGVPRTPQTCPNSGPWRSACYPGGFLFPPFMYLVPGSKSNRKRQKQTDQPCWMWLAECQSSICTAPRGSKEKGTIWPSCNKLCTWVRINLVRWGARENVPDEA